MVRHSLVLVLLVAATLGVVHAAATVRPETADVERSRTPSFRIKGTVRHLYPGARKVMRVRIRNLEAFPLKIRQIRARTIAIEGAPCPPDLVRVRPFRHGIRLAPRSTARIGMWVRMTRTATDACIGARLPLRFTGTAVRA